jgi:hypothetical protein
MNIFQTRARIADDYAKYMMLEFLLTRIRERSIRDAIYSSLRFELHTYRKKDLKRLLVENHRRAAEQTLSTKAKSKTTRARKTKVNDGQGDLFA